MNARPTFSFVSGAFLALSVTGLAINADPVLAQEAEEVIEEIIVEAPVLREVKRATIGATKMEIIELRRRVGYADLDLTKHADVTEFKARVETTAKESCEQLSEMFPLDRADNLEIQRCTTEAVHGAQVKVEAAIAAAH